MNKVGWKVVRKNEDGGFTSAVMIGGWCCHYEAGRRTTGHGDTPVLAFQSRQSARFFKSVNCFLGDCRVFKAKLDNPRPQRVIAEPTCPLTFKAFWEHGAATLNRHAPDGTLACDAITLLEPA